MSDSEFQVACVGDLGEGSCISATDIVYVAFRQDVSKRNSKQPCKRTFCCKWIL